MAISSWTPLSSSAGKDSENSNVLKDELSCLYQQMSSSKCTSALCSEYMKGIDKLLRQKQTVDQEICQLFKLLISTENDISLVDVLDRKLPLKFTKLQYFLRVFALRSLTRDKKADFTSQKLLEIAGERDQGRIAAIDFILTRSSPRRDLVMTLNKLIDALGDKKCVFGDPKRDMAIIQLRRLFPDSVFSLLNIQTSEDVVANTDLIMSSTSENIHNWLQHLINANNGRRGKVESRLSTSLVNLGLRLKENPISVAIWSASVRLENSEIPSKNIFGKVWRLILALNLHQNADYSVIPYGVVLCFRQLGIGHDTKLLSDENLVSFSGIASALLKVSKQWSRLFSLLNPQEPFTRLIAQLFLLLIAQSYFAESNVDRTSTKKNLSVLMELALQDMDLDIMIDIENAYCTIVGAAYNIERLEALIEKDETVKNLQRVKIFELLIQSYSDKPILAYTHCIRVLKERQTSEICSNLMKEYGFVDLIPYEPNNILLISENVNLSSLALETEKLRNGVQNSEQIFDFFIAAWQKLKSSGCSVDGLKFLKSAYMLSVKTWGSKSIRTWAVMRCLHDYRHEIGLNYDEFLNICQFPTDVNEEPSCLIGCIEAFASQLKIPVSKSYQDFSDKFRSFENFLSKEDYHFPWTSLPACVCDQSADNLVDLQSELSQISLAAQSIEITELSWEVQFRLAQKLSQACVLATSLGLRTTLQIDKLIIYLFSGLPIYASRSYHNAMEFECSFKGINDIQLPNNTICIGLRFDEDDTLTVIRFNNEGTRPFLAYLPLNRTVDGSVSFNYMNACEKIESIVNESVQNVQTNSCSQDPGVRKSFWKHQTELDKSMEEFCSKLQDCWIGGFVGLFADEIVEDMTNDKDLLENLNYAVTSICGVKVQLQPWIISLMRLTENETQLEDLIFIVVKAVGIHTNTSFDHRSLINSLKTIFHSYDHKFHDHQNTKRIVLVCDRKATAIPWEQLPILRSRSVTRVLSLHHLNELSNFTHHGIKASNPHVQYLVNPGLDLPPTAQDTLESFRDRGWDGRANELPTEAEILEQLGTATSFVYVGHGSGKNYVRGSAIRQMYVSPSAVFLMGCKSVAIKNPWLDDDALTEYIIKGSSLVMGTLWSVKDKDFNRFTQEFLSRVFDDRQPIGDALRDARTACVLPMLTGAAPVVYGLP